MTNEEAIARIKDHMRVHRLHEPRAILITKALDMAIDALEKQMPKKPKYVEVEQTGMDMETGEEYTYQVDEAHCSCCDSIIGSCFDCFAECYCPECGQRIDWEEGE